MSEKQNYNAQKSRAKGEKIRLENTDIVIHNELFC